MDWTAEQVKDKLRARYAATQRMGSRTIPGQWTCIEEYRGIDLLAWSAVQSPKNGAGKYPRIGHEVKVSRGDLRTELLNPSKRAEARDWCNGFYFVLPRDLLTDEELAWEEPAEFADPAAFQRRACDGEGCEAWFPPVGYGKRYRSLIGKRYVRETNSHEDCPECEGKGYQQLSLVEREAPTCWVPRDVGLILVDGRGTRQDRKSPVRHDVPSLDNRSLGYLMRWVSARPDPRHRGVVELARQQARGAID